MKYILDANTFIEAKNRFYSFDLCPGFWEWLEIFPKTNGVLTTTHVKEELLDGKDDLSEWIKKQPPDYFIDSSIEVQRKLREIVNFVKKHYLKQSELERFMGKADLRLSPKAGQLA